MAGKSVLILGGARSGKSGYAEELALAAPGERVYLATAEALDEEMAARIARHQEERGGAGWRTVECPLDLPRVIRAEATTGRVVLVDCLTLWLSNLMMAERDLVAERRALADALAEAEGTVLLVSNEVGQGIVPDNALARRFRDEAGWLNQAAARACDEVWFVIAGLPQKLK